MTSSPNVFDVSPTEGWAPTPHQTVRARVNMSVNKTEVLLVVSKLYPTIPQSLPVDQGLPALADRGRLESDPSKKLTRAEKVACIVFPDRLSSCTTAKLTRNEVVLQPQVKPSSPSPIAAKNPLVMSPEPSRAETAERRACSLRIHHARGNPGWVQRAVKRIAGYPTWHLTETPRNAAHKQRSGA